MMTMIKISVMLRIIIMMMMMMMMMLTIIIIMISVIMHFRWMTKAIRQTNADNKFGSIQFCDDFRPPTHIHNHSCINLEKVETLS